VPVDSLENSVSLVVPNRLEIVEFLKAHVAHPIIEFLRVGEVLVDVVLGLAVVERVLVLRIAEVAKHILGVAGELLEVEQFVESQLLHEPLLVLLRHLHLDLVVEVEIAALLLPAALRPALEVGGVRQHRARDGNAVFDGVAAEEREGGLVVVDGEGGVQVGAAGEGLGGLGLEALTVHGEAREDIFLELIKLLQFLHS
jgi:hypothetical protein